MNTIEEKDASDPEDINEDNNKKKYKYESNDYDVDHIDEESNIYDSYYDDFCEESLASVLHIEEDFGKGADISTETCYEHTSIKLN
eukprot:2334879-Ditylum_brightwellii.AAC.1